MVEVKIKPKREQQPSSILLKDLYQIVNDKKASHEERKKALDQINQQLAEPKPSEQKPIRLKDKLGRFVNKPTEKKICVGCGCEFTPNCHAQKFHNRECYEKSQFMKEQLERMSRLPRNPKPLIIPEPRKPYYCERCKTELDPKVFCGFCEKCKKLLSLLKDQKSLRAYLKKGNYLVYFENMAMWIVQPKALALENEAKGYDVYKGEVGSWLSDDLKERLKRL